MQEMANSFYYMMHYELERLYGKIKSFLILSFITHTKYLTLYFVSTDMYVCIVSVVL